MGGKGSGRPKGSGLGHYTKSTSKQFEKLKPIDEYSKGHEIELASKRYRHYSYNKNGEKYHSLINKNDPNSSFRQIPDSQYQAHLKRLAKGTDAYEKLWLYGKEGEAWRANNAREGLISRIENEFTFETFEINGVTYSSTDLIFELERLRNTQTWINVAVYNKDLISEYWDKYHSESGIAPPDTAGVEINLKDDDLSEADGNVQELNHLEQKEELIKLLERLLK